jgi:hypothetical protein
MDVHCRIRLRSKWPGDGHGGEKPGAVIQAARSGAHAIIAD